MTRVPLRHLGTHGGNNPESGTCDIIRVVLPQWSPLQEHLSRPLLTEPGPRCQHLALPATLSCPGMPRGGGTHPSCPKVMFSLNRRLSSRSSWVMWHHLSLQEQGGQRGASGPRPRRSTLPCSDLQVLASLTQRGLLGQKLLALLLRSLPKGRGARHTHSSTCPGRYETQGPKTVCA